MPIGREKKIRACAVVRTLDLKFSRRPLLANYVRYNILKRVCTCSYIASVIWLYA